MFQNEVQARFIELANKAYPKNPKDGGGERYKELKKAFSIFFIGKLRETYTAGPRSGLLH